jgi:hypothetical protein
MNNSEATNLLSPRTVLLPREHANVGGLDEAKIARDRFDRMVQDVFDAVLDGQTYCVK